jgi:hypothetical protein
MEAWIASSQELLAMTWRVFRQPLGVIAIGAEPHLQLGTWAVGSKPLKPGGP